MNLNFSSPDGFTLQNYFTAIRWFILSDIFYYSCSQYLYITVKGLFAQSDSVNVTVMFNG